jgi:hypothetical protein
MMIMIMMRMMKTQMIPVITGETGTISQAFIQYPKNIPGKRDIKELQKTAIL